MSGSKIRLYGSTSGYVELAAPAVSPDGVLTLPSTFAGIGSNVVSVTTTAAFSTTSTTYVDITDYEATITPSSDTSKILVIADVKYAQSTNNAVHIRLARGGSSIYDRGTVGSRIASSVSGTGGWSTTGYGTNATTLVFLDSPGVNTPVTYTVQTRIGSSGTVFIGSFGTDADNANFGLFPCTLTLIEVAA